MRKLSKLLTAVAAALMFAAAVCAPSAADEGKDNPAPWPGVSLGGRASYFWPNATSADAGNGNWMGGGQLRGYFWKRLGLEASADYRKQQFINNSVDVHIYPVQLTGMVYLTPQYRLSPLILGGVGWYVTHVEGPNGFDRTNDRFGEHVGGGLQFFASRHWSLDATYKYIFTGDIDAQRNGADVRVNGDGHQVAGGINYHF